MIQFEHLHYKIGGSYPKNPILRQNRRGKAKIYGDYSQVDLAMREVVRALNEEHKLPTFACCEYHPDEFNRKQYDTFKYKGQNDLIDYWTPYCSYIALDLAIPKNVTLLIEFLKGIGFVEDQNPLQSIFDKIEDDEITLRHYYGLHAEMPAGLLDFQYSCYEKGEPADGRISIEVLPFEGCKIRKWREWDNIRDSGWEYWLEILSKYIAEN